MAHLRIALLQSAGHLADVAANLAELDARAEQGRAAGAGLLVTTEMFLTGYELAGRTAELAARAAGEVLPAVADVARRHGLALLVGLPELDAEGRVVNSAVLLRADGEVAGRHVKTHLFGPAERAAFTPGDVGVTLVDLDGVRIAIMICYDVEFPETVRAAAAAGAHLVAVPTAQMEPYAFVAEHVIRTRAWENQVYVAYCNHIGTEDTLTFVGRSSVVAPSGEVLAGAVDEEALLLADVDTDVVTRAHADNPYLADRRLDLHPGPRVEVVHAPEPPAATDGAPA